LPRHLLFQFIFIDNLFHKFEVDFILSHQDHVLLDTISLLVAVEVKDIVFFVGCSAVVIAPEEKSKIALLGIKRKEVGMAVICRNAVQNQTLALTVVHLFSKEIDA